MCVYLNFQEVLLPPASSSQHISIIINYIFYSCVLFSRILGRRRGMRVCLAIDRSIAYYIQSWCEISRSSSIPSSSHIRGCFESSKDGKSNILACMGIERDSFAYANTNMYRSSALLCCPIFYIVHTPRRMVPGRANRAPFQITSEEEWILGTKMCARKAGEGAARRRWMDITRGEKGK